MLIGFKNNTVYSETDNINIKLSENKNDINIKNDFNLSNIHSLSINIKY